MTLTKTALYRASLLTDNVGIRLCLAAVLVMPSALVFLSPLFGLLDVDSDDLLALGPAPDGSWISALVALALCVGFVEHLDAHPKPRSAPCAGVQVGAASSLARFRSAR